MWAAQLLTLSRIPLALVFWIAVADARWAFATMAVAALTDVADGAVARRARRRAEASGVHLGPGPGAWLDPLCDKTFILSTAAAVASTGRVGPGPLLLVAGRETIMLPLLVFSDAMIVS